MRQILLALLVTVASCGGSQKPAAAPPPLPDTQPASETKPQEEEAKKAPEPPPPAKGPIDVAMSAPSVTVKLVSAGKGKKAPLKLTAKQGTKQAVELALDFAGKQDGPPETGGAQEDVAPTLVLSGDAEVKNVDASGNAEFELAFTKSDVRDVPGQKTPSAEMLKMLDLIKDLKLGGTVAPNGVASAVKLHLDSADPKAQKVLALITGEVLPTWPVLPTEPIGVGAKWQVTSNTKFADKLQVTQVSDYELVEHKGTTWTIKGTTKVTGTDQDLGGATASNIKGTGTIEVALADGALYPKMKNEVSTAFTVTVPPPPNDTQHKPVVVTFDLKQGTQVTPK